MLGKFRAIPSFDRNRITANVTIIDNSNCWIWNLFKDRDGYGLMTINGSTYRAHRASYSVFREQPGANLVIDHICRNRSCVNPEHLRLVTTKVNVTENSLSIQAHNSAKTHCKNGHEFTEKNTIIANDNSRQCRTCVNARQRKISSTPEAKEKKRIWKLKNKEKIYLQNKEWVAKNREKINRQDRERTARKRLEKCQ